MGREKLFTISLWNKNIRTVVITAGIGKRDDFGCTNIRENDRGRVTRFYQNDIFNKSFKRHEYIFGLLLCAYRHAVRIGVIYFSRRSSHRQNTIFPNGFF